MSGAARAAKEPRLLLLPIVVHSAEDPEYLRDGLSDMLAARFDRLGALDLVRLPTEGRGTTDLQKALALGRKADADYVLYGSFTRFGQGASLDVQCSPVAEDEDQEPLREIFVHSGSIGEIIPDLDELAGKVSRFARGEAISPPPVASGEVLAEVVETDAAVDMELLDDLVERVAALEAAMTDFLESQDEAEVIE